MKCEEAPFSEHGISIPASNSQEIRILVVWNKGKAIFVKKKIWKHILEPKCGVAPEVVKHPLREMF